MTRREQRIALLVFALFLPALAALFWGSRVAGTIDRPGALRGFPHAGQDHVALVFQRKVHVLDPQGRTLAQQPLADLGLTEEPTDLDVTVAPDGRIAAWLFEDTLPRLVRCDLEPASWRFARCAQVLGGPALKGGASSLAVHIAIDAARDRAFVAAASGRVRAFSLRDGRPLGETATGQLFFPNRLRIDGDQLVVADNDHHRIVWLDIAGETPSFRELRSLSLPAHPRAAGGGHKAADFAILPGDGDGPAALWALALAQGQKQGRVLLYGPQLAPRGVADTGRYRDPLIVDRLGRHLLAADFDAITWVRVAADGSFLGEFAQGALDDAARAQRARVTAGRRWTYAGYAGIALAVLLGFALALRARAQPGDGP